MQGNEMRMRRDWIIRKSLSIDCMRVRSTQFVLYVVLHTMNYKSKATIIQYTTIHLYLHRELPTSSLPLKPYFESIFNTTKRSTQPNLLGNTSIHQHYVFFTNKYTRSSIYRVCTIIFTYFCN